MKRKKDTHALSDVDFWVSHDEKSHGIYISNTIPHIEKVDDKLVYFLNLEEGNDRFIHANNFLKLLGVNVYNLPEGCMCHLTIKIDKVTFDEKGEVMTHEEINKKAML